MRLAKLTEERLAQSRFSAGFDTLPIDRQAAVRDEMRQQLQKIDLTQREVIIPDALAAAIVRLRTEMAKNLRTVDLTTGWTPAYSLDETEAAHTAEFLIYSPLTTVARRPDTTWSWTENWPYEPEVGNTPTTNTFVKKRVRELQRQFGESTVLIEDKASGTQLIQELNWDGLGAVKAYKPEGDKVSNGCTWCSSSQRRIAVITSARSTAHNKTKMVRIGDTSPCHDAPF
jgi:hypothetical protein